MSPSAKYVIASLTPTDALCGPKLLSAFPIHYRKLVISTVSVTGLFLPPKPRYPFVNRCVRLSIGGYGLRCDREKMSFGERDSARNLSNCQDPGRPQGDETRD